MHGISAIWWVSSFPILEGIPSLLDCHSLGICSPIFAYVFALLLSLAFYPHCPMPCRFLLLPAHCSGQSANQDKVFFIEPPVVTATVRASGRGRAPNGIRVRQHLANICANLSPSSTTRTRHGRHGRGSNRGGGT